MESRRPTSTDLAVVRGMALFRALPDTAFRRIAEIVSVADLPKGRVLFHQGDDAERLYGVISGWVEVYRNVESGDRAVLGLFGPGETFAEAAMFLGGGFPASAGTAGPCRICMFDRPAFERLLVADPRLCQGMLGSLAMHLHRVTHDVEQLQTRNGRQRLAGFLLRLCEGRTGRVEVTLPFDKALIAARLGMKPESLSRSFAGLRPSGVRVAHSVVTIDDTRRLADFCRNGTLRSRRSA